MHQAREEGGGGGGVHTPPPPLCLRHGFETASCLSSYDIEEGW